MTFNSISGSYKTASSIAPRFGNSKANEAAKWGETPQIQQKATVTAKNAMTDSYVEQLKEYAKKDA